LPKSHLSMDGAITGVLVRRCFSIASRFNIQSAVHPGRGTQVRRTRPMRGTTIPATAVPQNEGRIFTIVSRQVQPKDPKHGKTVNSGTAALVY
jgi:hypothetical protein